MLPVKYHPFEVKVLTKKIMEKLVVYQPPYPFQLQFTDSLGLGDFDEILDKYFSS